jgi:DNA-binding transcriptional LysR family regulator
VCLARKGHPGLRDGMTLEAFVALPHLLVTERGDAYGAVDEALAKLGLGRHVRLTVPHVLVVPTVLPHSDLIASVGARAARLFACTAPIDIYEMPLPIPAWRLSMLWSRQKAGDLGLAWLRDILASIGAQA